MLARLKPLASSLTINLIISLGLVSIFGVWLLLISTPEGLGLNDDSVAYITGARGILSGEGYRELWLTSRGPITHFPPGFSAVLALIGFITHVDPLRISRILNAFYFGGNAFLLGYLCWRATKSRLASILTSVFFIVTPGFLRIHSMAMSEPQYIFSTLAIILLFDIYFEGGQIKHLVFAGLLAGVAYLTRYAALALILTIIIAIVVLHETWRIRFMRSAIFIISTLPLIVGWSIRNEVVGGSITNRQAGWHPIDAENINAGLREFSLFLIPNDELSRALNITKDFYSTVLMIVAIVLLVWVLFTGMRHFFKPTPNSRPPLIPFVQGLYILGYFASLVVTMTVFDPATKFQLRIVAPIFVSLLFLGIFMGTRLRQSLINKSILAFVAIFFLVNFSIGQKQTVDELSKGGQLYASYRWYDSKILALARELPPGTAIHTNQNEVVYFYTQRATSLLPGVEDAENVKQRVREGKAVFVLFVGKGLDQETIDYYHYLGEGLKAIHEGTSVMYVSP